MFSAAINQQQNIISGPNTNPSHPGQMYWNHSPNLETPMIREEGPFPIEGNIGTLVDIEATSNFSACSNQLPPIGGSKNCTNVFKPDYYTPKNTCGSHCELKYPEAFGEKDFGLDGNHNTNAHQIHSYQNIRAGMPGQYSNSCYESIPRVSHNAGTGACFLDPQPEYQTVGNWMELPEFADLVNVEPL